MENHTRSITYVYQYLPLINIRFICAQLYDHFGYVCIKSINFKS
jgi:hypothetical protein